MRIAFMIHKTKGPPLMPLAVASAILFKLGENLLSIRALLWKRDFIFHE
jgi:hypothetical protein